jgi:hypothetical protein
MGYPVEGMAGARKTPDEEAREKGFDRVTGGGGQGGT